jgi:hypothetical protein
MSEVERRIREKIETFVIELNELVREAALDAVAAALGKAPARAKRGGRSPKPKPRGKGQKRSQNEIDRAARAIQSYVEKNAGQGAIAIARALGVSTKDLVLPIKKLLAAGTLSTKGKKRATKYYAK